jgi:hypothetical protein
MVFNNHEKFCKISIETGKGHRIRYKYFKCNCRKCRDGQQDHCSFKNISGEERSKWLLSNDDYGEIEKKISDENDKNFSELKRQTLLEAFDSFFSKYTHCDYPSVQETKCGMNRIHWCALIDACDIHVRRLDNREANPRVLDMQAALEEFGGWSKIIDVCSIYFIPYDWD